MRARHARRKPIPTPNRLRCFYRTGEGGRILEVAQTHLLRAEGWHEAEGADVERVLYGAHRWRRGDAGELVALPQVRLTLNDPVFRADGEDEAVFVLVALEDGAEGLELDVSVNGQAERWTVGEPHAVSTDAPGTWSVTLVDPSVACEERTMTATARAPEDFAS